MASTSKVENDALLAQTLQQMEGLQPSSPKLQVDDELDAILEAGLEDLEKEEERKTAEATQTTGTENPLLEACQQDLDKIRELIRLEIPEAIIAKAKEDPNLVSLMMQIGMKMAIVLPNIAFRISQIRLQIPESITNMEACQKWVMDQLTAEERKEIDSYVRKAIIEHYSTQTTATPDKSEAEEDDLDAILSAGLRDVEEEMSNTETTIAPHVVDPTLKALQEALGSTEEQFAQMAEMQEEMEKFMSSMTPEQFQKMMQAEEVQKQQAMFEQSILESLPKEASPEMVKEIVADLTRLNVSQHIIAVAQADPLVERVMVRTRMKIRETHPEIDERIQKLGWEYSSKTPQTPETFHKWIREQLTPEEREKIDTYERDAITQHYSKIIANIVNEMADMVVPEHIICKAKDDPYLLKVIKDIGEQCDTQYPEIAKKAAQIRSKPLPESVKDAFTYNRWMQSQLDPKDVALMNEFEKNALIAHYSKKEG